MDYTKLLEKLNPKIDGEDTLRLRTGTVDAVNADGTLDIEMSDGVILPNVNKLSTAYAPAGAVVQIIVFRGAMLVIGATGVSGGPVELTGSASVLGTTGSTSFTNTLTTSGIHGVAFIAPASGRVRVEGRATGRHGTVNSYTHLDYEVRQGGTPGSGTLVRASDADTSSVYFSPVAASQGGLNVGGMVTGLTPGDTYNASLTYRVDAGTGTYLRRYIAVYPE